MITVIIPVKDGALTLERCLKSIIDQEVPGLEIIILDSMSTDGSRDLARNYGALITDVPAGSFNHGLTRNIGVALAKHERVYLTVQDAWIDERGMLLKMSSYFEDPKVMGVVGQQAIPHEKDKNPLQWLKRATKPQPQIRRIEDNDHFNRLSPVEKESLISWDNVCSMYRTKALRELPFAETQFAEDWIWSRDAMLKGWTTVRDPSLLVYHYHHQGFNFAYKVAFAVNYHFLKFFGFLPAVPKLASQYARAIYHLSKNQELTVKEKLNWIAYNINTYYGTYKSHVDFLRTYKKAGFNAVEKQYNKVCETVPQGKQKS